MTTNESRGQKSAKEAAEAVGGHLAVCPHPGMDFNDMAHNEGLNAVAGVIDAGLAAEPHASPAKAELPREDSGETVEEAETAGVITEKDVGVEDIPNAEAKKKEKRKPRKENSCGLMVDLD